MQADLIRFINSALPDLRINRQELTITDDYRSLKFGYTYFHNVRFYPDPNPDTVGVSLSVDEAVKQFFLPYPEPKDE